MKVRSETHQRNDRQKIRNWKRKEKTERHKWEVSETKRVSIVERRKKLERREWNNIECQRSKKHMARDVPFPQSYIPDFFFQWHFKCLPFISNGDGELNYWDHRIEIRSTLWLFQSLVHMFSCESLCKLVCVCACACVSIFSRWNQWIILFTW